MSVNLPRPVIRTSSLSPSNRHEIFQIPGGFSAFYHFVSRKNLFGCWKKNNDFYALNKAQYLLLFRKFGDLLFYVYCSSFWGQTFECAVNLWASIWFLLPCWNEHPPSRCCFAFCWRSLQNSFLFFCFEPSGWIHVCSLLAKIVILTSETSKS